MTQSPHGGHAAPATTEFDDDGAPRDASVSAEPSPDLDRSASSTPPATSTPWGTTSTSTGIGYGNSGDWSGPSSYGSSSYGSSGSGPSGYGPSGTPPSTADAPTNNVPLVQGTAAPPQAGFPSRPAEGQHSAAPSTLPPASLPPPGLAASLPPQTGATGTTPRSARQRGPRRARLQLRHINPWTVLKFSCVLSIALFFVWLIVVGVLFGVLDGAGIIHKINDSYTTIQGGNAKAPVTAGVVFGGAAIIGAVNIVLFVALTTVGSVIYNLCADLVGGIEITLSES